MKKLIVANWKMNPTSLKEAKKLFEEIKKGIAAASAQGSGEPTDVVICPPSLYLKELCETRSHTVLGGQNMFSEDKGAFTGEISAKMIKDLGAEYVILGHSERRHIFGETDEMINKKVKKALEEGLKVIFCIGETQEQHDNGEKNKVLENQIKKGLDGISNLKFQIENLSVAYEPVWAIGTGNNCSVEETRTSLEFIKNLVPDARVLYGGSVKSENSGDYIKNANADGLLVGGASLVAQEFIKIVQSAE